MEYKIYFKHKSSIALIDEILHDEPWREKCITEDDNTISVQLNEAWLTIFEGQIHICHDDFKILLYPALYTKIEIFSRSY